MMNQRKVNWWVVTCICVAIAAFIWQGESKRASEKKQRMEHPATTCGRITSHSRAGNSGTVTKYEYFVNGIRYEAVSGDDKRFGDCIRTHSCIGSTFEVTYAEGNPANSHIDWSKPNCAIAP